MTSQRIGQSLTVHGAAVFHLSEDILATQYRGAGDAYAAVSGNQVVALRYYERDRLATDALPAWVSAVVDAAEGTDSKMMPTAWSSRSLAAIAKAASAVVDCPKPARRDRYRPTELLSMARAVIVEARGTANRQQKAEIEAELAQLGTVYRGMASCSEFVADRKIS